MQLGFSEYKCSMDIEKDVLAQIKRCIGFKPCTLISKLLYKYISTEIKKPLNCLHKNSCFSTLVTLVSSTTAFYAQITVSDGIKVGNRYYAIGSN